MRIEIVHRCIADKNFRNPGEVLDVEDAQGLFLIQTGFAIPASKTIATAPAEDEEPETAHDDEP